ncbi:Clavaminate synthase-like protein [Apiospora marii]|uniref:Clavaminate synthase-like protein n=1 Tax=Apiospora marii TaxID=335849 RepID=UPI0031326712
MAPAVDVVPFSQLSPPLVPSSDQKEYYSTGLRRRFQLDGLRVAPSGSSSAPSANVGYEVDESKFRERTEARLKLGNLPSAAPQGWPTEVKGPLVWSTQDFPNEDEYVYTLTETDITEIEEALGLFKEHDLDGSEVSSVLFPLPVLGSRLDKLRQDVYSGRGFVIIRGLDPDRHTEEDTTIIYLGLSSYIAERRGKQDQRGSMLSKKKPQPTMVLPADFGSAIVHVIKRNDETDGQFSEDKPFHTDTVTDCLGLYTYNLPEAGGRSILASAWTVYNELAATRPDLIHVLAQEDWPFDTFGRNPPFYKRALLYHHDSKIILSFSRRLLVGHLPFMPRSPGIPGLTEAQAEAMDAVHFLAKKHEFRPRMLKGDLRLINNMAIMHRREAFENSSLHSRHLVRMWLNNEEACWKLPGPLRIAWARIFDDEEREGHWDIMPVRKNGKILRVAGSCD